MCTPYTSTSSTSIEGAPQCRRASPSRLSCSPQPAPGAPGVHSFLFASNTPTHGMINDPNWDNATIGGTLLRNWVGGAIGDPDGVTDKVATGTLEADRPGVLPFPCTPASPSGAFLDLP
jgi:hypothetical protein